MVFRTKDTGRDEFKKKVRLVAKGYAQRPVSTRPDITFAVNFLNQFNANYNAEHWKAAKRVLWYLSGTKGLGLLDLPSKENLYGVADADWGANLSDRRSYSGQAFVLSGAAMSWEARKQRTVALSSTESEYLAMSEAVKESIYLRSLLTSIGGGCDSIQDLVTARAPNTWTCATTTSKRSSEIEYLSTELMRADVD
ncbi:secreted RxLR effector protein 161-like [Drosophila elegans]|uniref:secreted RxLR effector protein 161-like n=1 Tax=Drosophila elegans TaxID=30023 RepID=UPI001BC8308C|nr:secreted RxLR effector protein 161-like [Drosophila elegans]